MKLMERVYGNDDEYLENKEVFNYGYEMLKTAVVGLIVGVAIAIIMKELVPALIFIAFVMPLRQNAGGYHAKSRGRCAIISALIYICSLYLIKYLPIMNWCIVSCFLLSAIIIINLAPIDNCNHVLDEVEIKVYGTRTRLILAIESIVFLVLFSCKLYRYSLIIITSFMVVALILIAGKIKNRVTA